MKKAWEKYRPFVPIGLPERSWPDRVITKAPVWCSVDLRDGNQALVEPMNLEEKLLFFKTLVEIGFKEIEVGFPSASETEYEILRALIERNLIPDDVTIQVLVQARPHLIRKTFDAIDGAKNVIIHFYNSTSTLQRKVVFHKEMDGIIDIAVEGAKLIRELTENRKDKAMNITYEYSPESFSGTEPENAVIICDKVVEALGVTPENKVILNLPNTVENATPNCFADQVEYFCTHLKNKDSAIISVHPHNDRGCGVAATELAIMAGAQRVEGTVFGNGERTGNADIMVIALNMFSQGVDPKLDFSKMPYIKSVYEKCTKMNINERHPYAGDLVFTAFSGSHQDAINKGIAYMKDSGSQFWEVPYLPIDPADIGREYEPIIRINSQSGKGGAAYIMHTNFGYDLPKAMHPEFGALVKAECDRIGAELKPDEVYSLFEKEYLSIHYPYNLKSYRLIDNNDSTTEFEGVIRYRHQDYNVKAKGNGPVDAFFSAVKSIGIHDFEFITYSEHALSSGADSKAVAYIKLRSPNGSEIYGVGVDNNILIASIKGVICAVNRSMKQAKGE